ncbi:MAG: double zinc ribbon domain-containing protein [Verrucomicrobiota bacterium]
MRKSASKALKLFHAAADLIFPRSCLHCGEVVEAGAMEYLCADCASQIFFAEPPACVTCGHPFAGMLAGPQACPHCAELHPVFDQGKTLLLAKGPGRSIIHEIKYQSGFYALKDLQRIVEQTPHFLNYLADSVLVPVPLHPAKARERGYNQSEKIAEMLADVAVGAELQRLLERVEYTQTQTRLNRSERHKNVKNAFALTSDAVVIPDQPYVLIDDVFTTGATLNACAQALRDAGATRLKIATIGHG